MNRLLICIAALLALAWAAPPALAQPDADQLAAQVQARYRGVDTLAADYKRTSRFVAAGGQGARTVEANGRINWARPLRLRLDQTKPKPMLIVAGQGQVWWAQPTRRRVDLYPLGNFTSGMASMLDVLGGLANLTDNFRIAQAQPDELMDSSWTLVLEPRKPRADLARLAIWLEPEDLTLWGFRIVSLVGDVNQYTFSDTELNAALDPELFTYTPPEGWRVVDHRPRQGGPAQPGQ